LDYTIPLEKYLKIIILPLKTIAIAVEKLILFSIWRSHLQNSSGVQKLYNTINNTINKPNRFTNLSASISE